MRHPKIPSAWQYERLLRRLALQRNIALAWAIAVTLGMVAHFLRFHG